MQHVKEGNLIAIKEEGLFYYFLILSGSAFFGGQWAYAFHETSNDLLEENVILQTFGQGFHAIIDFIDERRENRIIKISKLKDCEQYKNKHNLKAKIKEPNGQYRWYIYSQDFSILDIQDELKDSQYEYPIGSGNRFKDAVRMIKFKWFVREVLLENKEGNFPYFIDDLEDYRKIEPETVDQEPDSNENIKESLIQKIINFIKNIFK